MSIAEWNRSWKRRVLIGTFAGSSVGDSWEISWAFRQGFRGRFCREFLWELSCEFSRELPREFRRAFRGGFVGVSWELLWRVRGSSVRISRWEFGFQGGSFGSFAVPTLFSDSARLGLSPVVKRLEPLSFAVGELDVNGRME